MDGPGEFLRQIGRGQRAHDIRQALTVAMGDDMSATCSSWGKIIQCRGFVVRLMRDMREVREENCSER
jgi:hypothetical protein